MIRRIQRRAVVIILKRLSRLVVKKYHPKVVAITGSVGKTTTKECIAVVLSNRFQVRHSSGNYNNELGVPLTILGEVSGTSLRHWLTVFRRGLRLLTGKHDYPEVLVLEMGADRPGDIGYLTAIAPPDIAVVTNVGSAHRQNYSDAEGIAREKAKLIERLRPGGTAVLNFDDVTVRLMRPAEGQVLYYGLTDEANVWIDEIERTAAGLRGMVRLKESADGQAQSLPVKTAFVGRHQLYAALAAFAVAVAAGVDHGQAIAAIERFRPLPGRLTLLKGKDGLTILDDSYNSSPEAALRALEVLRDFPKPHRAVLGDMLELGKASEAGHHSVGDIAGRFLDELVVVGERAAIIADAAKEAGMDPDRIWFATEASQAGDLVNQDHGGGTVLVKGSRGVRLERAVKELLLDPRDSKRLVH